MFIGYVYFVSQLITINAIASIRLEDGGDSTLSAFMSNPHNYLTANASN